MDKPLPSHRQRYRLRFACSYHNPCRICHSNPIIIASTRYPLDSILPCAAPEDLTLTRSAVDVSYFVSATVKHPIKVLQSEAEKNTSDKFEHGVLSINIPRLCPHTLPLKTSQQCKTPIQRTILPAKLQCLPLRLL